MARDKLDKLAGISPELQKQLGASWPMVAKIYDAIAAVREQIDDIKREDERRSAQQKFFVNAPINGTYHHGLEALSKLIKG
jgi:hypothetical protein